MREARLTQKRSVLFGITFIVLLGLFHFLPDRFFYPVRGVLATVTLPFANLFSWTAFELREVSSFWGSLRNIKEENERLHRELLALKSDRALVVSLREENEDLRRELNLSQETNRTLITGEVIARDRGGLSTSIRINRGAHQGIASGMPVIAGGNVLVGRIETVAPFSSEVRLLSHADSLVAAKVEGVSGETLVRGDHGIGLLLDLARPNEKLEKGASVVTAGLGDGLPGGLFIGTIESTRLSGDQLFQQAIVVPPIRADTLRFMSVITAFAK